MTRRHSVTVDRAPASTWIREQLARPIADDVLTVIWQSITAQYWPTSERESVTAAVAVARDRMPLAHVSMGGLPPPQTSDGYAVERCGPATRVDGILIARSHHHGSPVILL